VPEFAFDALRRWPDLEAPNLHAVDAADRLILDEGAPLIEACGPGDLVVIGDQYGALTLGAAAQGADGIRVHQDPLSGERALAANAARTGLARSFRSAALDAGLLAEARLVLMRLPRQLEALDEIATLVAAHADPDVVVIAGGRLKHMTVAMNEVLGRSFGGVSATLARQKSRLLVARGPLDQARERVGSWPAHEHHADLGLEVCAHGAAFAGTRVDIGTRFLLGFLDDMLPDARQAIDLGCGTGVLATSLARARPALAVTATDQSAAAVASARATAEANEVADRVRVVRDDGLAAQPEASADLIVLNPPFHVVASVHTGVALALFEHAGRVLRPGGELWTVWNPHLGYRPALERLVGPTRQAGRNPKFTVTVSTGR